MEEMLENLIQEADVISIDLSNTLFSPCKIDKFDFYQELERKYLANGINLTWFADRFLNIQWKDESKNFEQILREVAIEKEIPESQMGRVFELALQMLIQYFVPRKAVLDIFKYAVSLNKKVCIIDDNPEYKLTSKLLERLLAAYQVEGYDRVFCGIEYQKYKWSGLYQEVLSHYGSVKYLHLGDDKEQDEVIPEGLGFKTFLIKSPRTLFEEIDVFDIEMLENRNVRKAFENYLLKVYVDDFSEEKADEKRISFERMATQLQYKINFYKVCGDTFEDEPADINVTLVEGIEYKEDIRNCPVLTFPVCDKPMVSIVIPVYNQFAYTYDCLNAILQHSGDVAYEVIIADDCSTDQVAELEQVVTGIRILHNKKNLRFLLNCNQAAEYAKGKYILFLNNDTQVQPGWLKPLVDLIENDDTIGMVGSKLIYPQGYLQEAGGILWKDGSAWNYGHMKNPGNPEFNYVKEADYISGAAIMIRRDLWQQLGGFDTAFVPAYYEDTDLAFQVRKAGYRVVYQPLSVVVHFEGISNGTDTAEGLKAYQVANQKKFFQKWKDVLGKEHFANGENVYLAKDRGQKKTQILVIDHFVPNFDKDAGGRCTYMYIKAFINMGMKVTFIGENFAKPEPYTTILNQMGVEVLYGNYYQANWEEWLQENACHFDYIYTQRPHISIKFMDVLKEYSRAKIFYFAHDLHHIRMMRDYEVTGKTEAREEAKKWKKIEYELFEKTDVGHVVGSFEQQIMQDAFPDKPIRNIPLYIYDDEPADIEKDFSKRQDILFVGGFGHQPNVDAVIWFADKIFPVILEKYPYLKWHIVGGNAPKEVKSLAGDNIILEGYLSDEELEQLYRKCRMVVVPLRYGAGVKGKIVEAAYYQIPVVTTSIGGEGLDAGIGSFKVEDDEKKLAGLMIELYEDYEQLNQMSDAGKKLIEKYFTSRAAEEVLRLDMNIR
ncbi:MAG: glycosyltransferase [Lachnospiraceae bacterium]|nr:glycosyltransferase [Lachnospiraceae bacterium]